MVHSVYFLIYFCNLTVLGSLFVCLFPPTFIASHPKMLLDQFTDIQTTRGGHFLFIKFFSIKFFTVLLFSTMLIFFIGSVSRSSSGVWNLSQTNK